MLLDAGTPFLPPLVVIFTVLAPAFKQEYPAEFSHLVLQDE